MSSESWFGHQSRLVRPRSDLRAAGSLPGSLSGLPLVFASIVALLFLFDWTLGLARHRRKRGKMLRLSGAIDQCSFAPSLAGRGGAVLAARPQTGSPMN